MLRCRDVVQWIGTDALPGVPWRTRLAVRLHLAMCVHCRAYARALRQLARSARALVRMESPAPGGAESQIIQEVRRAAERWRP